MKNKLNVSDPFYESSPIEVLARAEEWLKTAKMLEEVFHELYPPWHRKLHVGLAGAFRKSIRNANRMSDRCFQYLRDHGQDVAILRQSMVK